MLEVIEVVVEPDVSLVICVIEDKIELSGLFLRQLSVTPKLGQHYPPPEEIAVTKRRNDLKSSTTTSKIRSYTRG